MSKTQLRAAVQPILDHLHQCDLSSHDIQADISQKFPLEKLDHIRNLVKEGIQEGWFAPREGHNLTYGRLCKPSEESHGFSVETVDMTSTGPGHTHPLGEIDLCFSLEGHPLFDGRDEGWTCYPPNSWHTPTVSNGRMAILYFLPQGSIRFEKAPIG